jgi:transcriptional regulator with PAS, ATPase and Fis domain
VLLFDSMNGRKRPDRDKTEESRPRIKAVSRSPAKIYFFIVSSEATRMIPLHPDTKKTIGRDRGSDIAVEDARMSRLHAEFRRIRNKVVVTDLGSTNGTCVNGKKISRTTELMHGDAVEVGDTRVVIIKVAPLAEKNVAEEYRSPVTAELSDVIIKDPTMVEIYRLCDRIAKSFSSVLIMGETGVGKEIIARYIHNSSHFRKGPFVAINCSVIPEHLAESELFGYEKGAFTGAAERKIGHIESAAGGTLFLDEITDLPVAIQSKLLRFLDNKRFTRLGGVREAKVDVRIIGATNKDVEEEVETGKMRKDLFYRLNQFMLCIPPLRSRPDEIQAIAKYHIKKMSKKLGKKHRISKGAMDYLKSYSWPGNVRQLKHVMEQAVILSEDEEIDQNVIASTLNRKPDQALPGAMISARIEEVERKAIMDALKTCNGNRTRAAELLGISRRKLIYRMKKYKIN